jgi:hypothetical protein
MDIAVCSQTWNQTWVGFATGSSATHHGSGEISPCFMQKTMDRRGRAQGPWLFGAQYPSYFCDDGTQNPIKLSEGVQQA